MAGSHEPHLNPPPPIHMNFTGFSLSDKGERQKFHMTWGSDVVLELSCEQAVF